MSEFIKEQALMREERERERERERAEGIGRGVDSSPQGWREAQPQPRDTGQASRMSCM